MRPKNKNPQDMLKAAILAGGRGVRLRPVTDAIPKPMIEIRGRPFLEYQVNLLCRNDITEILLCVGYLKEIIMNYFEDGSRFGVKIEYSIEDDFLGTGGALKKAERYLPKEFILLYGDSYLPIDYRAVANFWSQNKIEGLVVCYDNRENIANNNIYLDSSKFVTVYNKRNPGKNMNYIEAGVMLLKKKVIENIPAGTAVSLEEEIFPFLIRRGCLMGYPTAVRFYDIGTHKGLKEIEGALA